MLLVLQIRRTVCFSCCFCCCCKQSLFCSHTFAGSHTFSATHFANVELTHWLADTPLLRSDWFKQVCLPALLPATAAAPAAAAADNDTDDTAATFGAASDASGAADTANVFKLLLLQLLQAVTLLQPPNCCQPHFFQPNIFWSQS